MKRSSLFFLAGFLLIGGAGAVVLLSGKMGRKPHSPWLAYMENRKADGKEAAPSDLTGKRRPKRMEEIKASIQADELLLKEGKDNLARAGTRTEKTRWGIEVRDIEERLQRLRKQLEEF